MWRPSPPRTAPTRHDRRHHQPHRRSDRRLRRAQNHAGNQETTRARTAWPSGPPSAQVGGAGGADADRGRPGRPSGHPLAPIVPLSPSQFADAGGQGLAIFLPGIGSASAVRHSGAPKASAKYCVSCTTCPWANSMMLTEKVGTPSYVMTHSLTHRSPLPTMRWTVKCRLAGCPPRCAEIVARPRNRSPDWG